MRLAALFAEKLCFSGPDSQVLCGCAAVFYGVGKDGGTAAKPLMDDSEKQSFPQIDGQARKLNSGQKPQNYLTIPIFPALFSAKIIARFPNSTLKALCCSGFAVLKAASAAALKFSSVGVFPVRKDSASDAAHGL